MTDPNQGGAPAGDSFVDDVTHIAGPRPQVPPLYPLPMVPGPGLPVGPPLPPPWSGQPGQSAQPPMAPGPQPGPQPGPHPVQPPSGGGYQGYPVYAGPGATSGTVSPEVKKGGKGKVIAIVAAAVVVAAVAAGAGWFFCLRGGGGTSINHYAAPDFKDKPGLGDEIVAADLLEGDFYAVYFDRFADAGHMLVIGDPDPAWLNSGEPGWFIGYDEEYARGYQDGEAYLQAYEEWWVCYDDNCPESPILNDYYRETAGIGSFNYGYGDGWSDASDGVGYGYTKAEAPDGFEVTSAIGLADLDTGQLDWQLDLVEATGFGMPQVNTTRSSGGGITAVQVSDLVDKGQSTTILAINLAGEVVGTRDNGTVVYATGDYFLIKDGDDLSAVKASDIETDLWTAEASSRLGYGSSSSSQSQVLMVDDDTTYVLVDDGFVDLETGEEIGWGEDAGDGAYYMVPGDGIVLRCQVGDNSKCDLMRIDAKTGQDKWDSEVEDAASATGALADGKLILAAGREAVAVDPETGEEQWSAEIGSINVVYTLSREKVLAVSRWDGETATFWALETSNGEVATMLLDTPAYDGCMGTDVFYSLDGDQLVAYDLTGQSTQALWQLDLELGSDDSGYVLPRSGRLWLEITHTRDDDYEPDGFDVLREIVE
ncbi:MAG: PQQ-like beta-propeller repeat protein [Bifidobacteriaceae bacterium]|jgi:hypothetical protein|nr:PQQ-like beta-propeller repeat protein [Bifidobacteriaceae bacterium]